MVAKKRGKVGVFGEQHEISSSISRARGGVEAFTHHHQPTNQSGEGDYCWMNDEYLDAVLDGDAGERVHPSNLVLQEVAVGERR